MSKVNPKLAAYLAASRPATSQPTERADSPAPRPSDMEPKNPACGCSYCTGNALVIPQSHKPLRGKSKSTAPVAVFAPAPDCTVEIQVSYAVQGFQSRAVPHNEPHPHGPPIFNEQIACVGWTMPAPAEIQ